MCSAIRMLHEFIPSQLLDLYTWGSTASHGNRETEQAWFRLRLGSGVLQRLALICATEC